MTQRSIGIATPYAVLLLVAVLVSGCTGGRGDRQSGRNQDASGTAGGTGGVRNLTSPPRPTIAYLSSDFAKGAVKMRVTLKVIGWQGSPSTRRLIVRVVDGRVFRPNGARRRIDLKKNDLLLHVLSSSTDPASLEGKPVSVEFRPSTSGYAAYLAER